MTDHTDRCTAPKIPSLRLALGGYVLGALGSAETDQVTAHLADCPSCHEEYLELLDLVPLLACVTEADAVHGPIEPDPDALGQTLAAWRRDTAARQPSTDDKGRHPPMRSRRARYALAGACLALLAGVGAITVDLPAGDHAGTQSAWSATAVSAPDPADPDADGATASVHVSAATWGSTIELTIEHVAWNYECTMIVVAADGHHETAGTWKAPSSGTITIPGTVGLEPDQITAIEVRLPDGATLVTLERP
jgi:anti-sigma factor RsiW